ncbi:MAG TPA: hypothetical protein DEH02_13305 [Bacteroidales bacterium]|nr:MAG: hypothetical protein A2X01_13595 [Bacteroidetes bacterium GWF2_35_48]OFZ00805.1 MAG: hypothetical protein A2491_21510 [Bacteroidetes bacterium RIFOXYC12_FULL_35_7]HBX52037.1 hypothetical protein [Bacteroidales bacterium]
MSRYDGLVAKTMTAQKRQGAVGKVRWPLVGRLCGLFNIIDLWDGFGRVVASCGSTIRTCYVK